MQSVNITLPDRLREFVFEQVETGYDSASDYIRELIQADQAQKSNQKLEALLLEGLDSGEGRVFSEQDWLSIREGIVSRYNERQGSK